MSEGLIPAIVIGWRELAALLDPLLPLSLYIQACSLNTPTCTLTCT